MKTQWLHYVRRYWLVLVAMIIFPVLAMATDDAVITGKINSMLATNQVTHGQNIQVETNNGIVSLRGVMHSETSAAKAVEIAESTIGVRSVDASQLYVLDSHQPLTDAYITAKVKGTFLRHNLTADREAVPLMGVKVETQNGVVYLSGSVKNFSQRVELIHLAKSVDGVTSVKSTIKIKG